MKDYGREQLEASRPSVDAGEAVRHALEALYEDKTRSTSEEVVRGLLFEELIGALLLARDLADTAAS